MEIMSLEIILNSPKVFFVTIVLTILAIIISVSTYNQAVINPTEAAEQIRSDFTAEVSDIDDIMTRMTVGERGLSLSMADVERNYMLQEPPVIT